MYNNYNDSIDKTLYFYFDQGNSTIYATFCHDYENIIDIITTGEENTDYCEFYCKYVGKRNGERLYISNEELEELYTEDELYDIIANSAYEIKHYEIIQQDEDNVL